MCSDNEACMCSDNDLSHQWFVFHQRDICGVLLNQGGHSVRARSVDVSEP